MIAVEICDFPVTQQSDVDEAKTAQWETQKSKLREEIEQFEHDVGCGQPPAAVGAEETAVAECGDPDGLDVVGGRVVAATGGGVPPGGRRQLERGARLRHRLDGRLPHQEVVVVVAASGRDHREAPDEPVIFYVRDNGTGIEAKYQEKLFELFELFLKAANRLAACRFGSMSGISMPS